MGWIQVDEPFAAAPKLGSRRATVGFEPDHVEIDRGLAELSGIGATDEAIDLRGATDVAFDGCTFESTRLELTQGTQVEIVGSDVEGCDLSHVDFALVRRSRFVDTKFVGTDFSGTALTDVVFENCVIRLASFRMASLTRVRFDGCTIDDVDCYDATLADVDFTASRLTDLNVDQVDALRVDLRGAASLGLKGAKQLSGFLVEESQLMGLAYVLASAVGLDVERDD